MISNNVRKQIVNDTSIVEVVSEYLPLTRKGNSYFGICPFHDDNNPSMSVSDSVKMFNCFSCNTKGNVITFVSKYENITIDQATIKLAKRLGMEIKNEVSKEEEKKQRLENVMNEAANFYSFYLKNSEEGVQALEYLHNRGITDEIIDKFRIGLAPNLSDGLYQFLTKKGCSELDQIELGLIKQGDNGKIHDVFRIRIMFPLAASTGKIVGFSGRIYTESNQAKYINSIESTIFHKGEVLYNMHNAALPARQMDKIYLFEGFMDVIAAYREGIKNGVATMGTALTKEHIQMLFSVTKNIVLCFDGDDAGIKAMRRSAKMLSSHNVIPEAIVLPNNQDPDEYIKDNGAPQLQAFLITKAKPVYYWLYQLEYQKVFKNDISSVEKFKKSVFEFISESNQATIIDYYLNLMAKDLNIGIESLKNDFSNYKPNTVVNNNKDMNDIIAEDIVQKPVVELKEVTVTKAVRKAYEIIIKHAIYRYDALVEYLNLTDKVFLGNDLLTEFEILQIISVESLIYPDLRYTKQYMKHNIDVLLNEFKQSIFLLIASAHA